MIFYARMVDREGAGSHWVSLNGEEWVPITRKPAADDYADICALFREHAVVTPDGRRATRAPVVATYDYLVRTFGREPLIEKLAVPPALVRAAEVVPEDEA